MADDNNVSEKLDPVKMASTSPSASPTKDKNLTHYRYNSTEILALQNSQLSRTRPAWLSKEFDNAKGEFSPDKWIQHLWQSQGGVENINKRPNAKNLVATGASAYPTPNMLSAIMEAASNGSSEIDQQTILSPQRRGFSSGCRAASPKNDTDKHPPTKSRWRQGTLNNGVDFKPAFQKSALEANSRSSRSGSSHNNASGNGSWTVIGGPKHHPWDKNRRGERERTRSSNTEEALPEWMDEGPISQSDTIELKGFDDDISSEKVKRRPSKGSKEQSVGPKPVNSKSSAEHRATAANRSDTRPRSRQKRHSSGDISQNISRPASRQTPLRSIGDPLRKNSSISPIRFIQASDLESSILKEQQEKLKQEKFAGDKTLEILSALGIEPPKQSEAKKKSEKMPNSDAELAAYILGLSTEQIVKPGTGMSNKNPSSASPTHKQKEEPTQSRLSRFFATKNSLGNLDNQKAADNNKSPVATSSLTKSRLDLSALQAQLQGSPTARQASTPPIISFQQHFQNQLHQRPASAEHQQQRFSPNFAAMSSGGGLQQPNNRVPGMTMLSAESPEFIANRNAVLQQMQSHMPGGNFFPNPSQQRQLLEQFQKRTSPVVNAASFVPGVGQRPLSTEMLSSPIFPHQQQRLSPLQQNNPMMPTTSHGENYSRFPVQFQQLLNQTARKFMQNPHQPPDENAMNAAYAFLREDPKMFAALMGQQHQQQSMNFGANSFPGTNNQPFMPPPPPFFGGSGPGGHFPYNNFPGMPHPQFGPPSSGIPLPMPSHLRALFGPNAIGVNPPPFHAQQFGQNVVFPPPPMVGNPYHNPHQQKPGGYNQNQNVLNTPAFMPTSVMRQLSKATGAGGSTTSGGEPSGASSSNTPSNFFQKLLADAHGQGGSGNVRAILGRDPALESSAVKNPPRVSGCMKLEDLEQRELAACQQAVRNMGAGVAPPNPNSAAL